MPASPNTPAIESSIQNICKGLQVNNATFFAPASVIIGRFKDISSMTPACEITLADDQSKRYTTSGGPARGGLIDDSCSYWIEVTLDMGSINASAVQAEQTLALIRDSLSYAFMQSATLNTPGVAYSGWEGNGQIGYSLRNGQTWRVYKRKLLVRWEYAVTPIP